MLKNQRKSPPRSALARSLALCRSLRSVLGNLINLNTAHGFVFNSRRCCLDRLFDFLATYGGVSSAEMAGRFVSVSRYSVFGFLSSAFCELRSFSVSPLVRCAVCASSGSLPPRVYVSLLSCVGSCGCVGVREQRCARAWKLEDWLQLAAANFDNGNFPKLLSGRLVVRLLLYRFSGLAALPASLLFPWP